MVERYKDSARSGSLGDAMEAAEVRATEKMAKTCRRPEDYALWTMVGRGAVQAAGKMTHAQRAVFVATMERFIEDARREAMTNAPGRLQAALGFAPDRVKPIEGFDDED
jgi:hypothetical protein